MLSKFIAFPVMTWELMCQCVWTLVTIWTHVWGHVVTFITNPVSTKDTILQVHCI